MRYLLLNKDIVWLDSGANEMNTWRSPPGKKCGIQISAPFGYTNPDRFSGTPESAHNIGPTLPSCLSNTAVRNWTAIWMLPMALSPLMTLSGSSGWILL